MMKILNIKGIAVLLIIFAVIQAVSALFISPVLTPVIVDALNKRSGARISVSKAVIWPLTLSCSLKDLKVFDPDNEKERIALIPNASIRLSPLGLLSKRLVISRMAISGAEITLKGEPDGSFNVERLARPGGREPARQAGPFDRFKKDKDLFSRIYNAVKDRSSKEAPGKKAAQAKERKTAEREVVGLPRGRKVRFIKPGDNYVFQIKDFAINNSLFSLETDAGETAQFEKVSFRIGGLAMDPASGARFDKLGAKGVIKKSGRISGSFDMAYAQGYKRGRQVFTLKLSANDVDLNAVKFIYRDSLPVDFESGVVSINSDTKILNGALDSANSMKLTGHNILPKGRARAVGFVPMPVVCGALNKIDPLKMKFDITGTVDKPQFKGFEEILLNIIKPHMADITGDLKKQGLDALGGLFKKE